MPLSALTGTRLRERRLALGLKQAELAQRVGVSASYLNLIEHNRRRISEDLLARLALALGQPVGESFSLRRPLEPTGMDQMRARIGARLHLALNSDPSLVLRGLAQPTADRGLLINLSFGIWVHEAVRRYGLSAAHFAATDLTIEMLYLVEAKRAVLGELQRLNARLQGAANILIFGYTDAANAAREAFEVLRTGRVPLQDLQAAFDKYAQSQVAAFGESRRVYLEEQAAVLGLVREIIDHLPRRGQLVLGNALPRGFVAQLVFPLPELEIAGQ